MLASNCHGDRARTQAALRHDPDNRRSVAVLDHIGRRGLDLFRAACERDLEVRGGKWATDSYVSDGRSTSWLKIKNPNYEQIGERHELFEARTT
jgi:hypothetical protein